MTTPTDSEYGVVNRLVALLEQLRADEASQAMLLEALQQYYPPEKSATARRRRLERDLQALRKLGHRIPFNRQTKTYQLLSAFTLTDEEAMALESIRVSLAESTPQGVVMAGLVKKLMDTLPEARRERLEDLESPVALPLKPAIDYQPYAKTFQALQRALDAKQRVRFLYQSPQQRAPEQHLRVEPYEIQMVNRHYFLIGYSDNGDRILEFRIDRIRDLEVTPTRRGAKRKRPTIKFKYVLAERVVRGGLSERFLNQRTLNYSFDGDAVIEAEGYTEFRIVQELLRYGEQAEILDPPELRAKMAQVAQAMWHKYHSDK